MQRSAATNQIVFGLTLIEPSRQPYAPHHVSQALWFISLLWWRHVVNRPVPAGLPMAFTAIHLSPTHYSLWCRNWLLLRWANGVGEGVARLKECGVAGLVLARAKHAALLLSRILHAPRSVGMRAGRNGIGRCYA